MVLQVAKVRNTFWTALKQSQSFKGCKNIIDLIVFCDFKGLKTGMYYLRTKPAANAIQFSIDKSKMKKSSTTESNGAANGVSTSPKKEEEERQTYNMSGMVCSLENKDDCLMCGS